MFYPTSLKLWRLREEIESCIDLWVTRLMKGEYAHLQSVTSGAAAFARPKPGSVESWKSAISSSANVKTSKVDNDAAPLLAVGTSARKEMLLERLPYMVLVAKARKSSSCALAIKDMEKVTSFHGIGGPSDDSPDEGDDNTGAGEEWATDKPVEGRSPKKKGAGGEREGNAFCTTSSAA